MTETEPMERAVHLTASPFSRLGTAQEGRTQLLTPVLPNQETGLLFLLKHVMTLIR